MVVLPLDADIIVYLLVFGDHTSAVPTLMQSLPEHWQRRDTYYENAQSAVMNLKNCLAV
jgi:hypothetical protein